MYKLLSFLNRDFQIQFSYKFRMIMGFVSSIGAVVMVFFMGKMFQNGFSAYLSRYGNDYFAFSLLGMCVSTFVSTGLYSLADSVRGAQMQGTLEVLLVTKTSPNMILFGNSMWSFVDAFLQSVLYLVITIIIVGIHVNPVQILLVMFVLLLTFMCFLSLGMISAAFIMVFKQGNPINLIFGTSSYYLGGLVFPVEVLPVPLQKISFFLPMSHAAKAVREILLVAPAEAAWKVTVIYLTCFSLVLCPLGFLSLRMALLRAKKDGSLVQF